MFYNLIAIFIFSILFLFTFDNSALYFSLALSIIHYYISYYYIKLNSIKFLLNPLFINLLLNFIYIFLGVFNTLAFTNKSIFVYNELIVKSLYITNISISSQYIGFYLYNIFKKDKLIFSLPNIKININIIIILILTITFLEVYFSYQGVTGYFSVINNLPLFSTFNQFLMTTIYLSFLLLVYSTDNKKIHYLLSVALSTMGIFSGSKTLIIMPFAYLFIIYTIKSPFLIKNFKYLIFLLLIISFSFLVITPIRYVLIERKQGYTVNNNTYKVANNLLNDNFNDVSQPFEDLSRRFNKIPQLTTAIDYDGPTPESVNNLWKYTFMSPVYAFLPSFIIENRPKVSFGSWFAQVGFNTTEDTNVGATFQGILFMNGGIISVIFGFLLVGFVQYFLYKHLLNKNPLIYIALLQTITFLPQEPWLFYVSNIQSILFIFILYYTLKRIKIISVINAK